MSRGKLINAYPNESRKLATQTKSKQVDYAVLCLLRYLYVTEVGVKRIGVD